MCSTLIRRAPYTWLAMQWPQTICWSDTGGRECAASFASGLPPGAHVPPSGASGQNLEASGVAYSPDGKRLAAAGDNGQVLVWDVQSGASDPRPVAMRSTCLQQHRFQPRRGNPRNGWCSGTVSMWDVGDFSASKSLPILHHGAEITDIAFAPDGSHLATAGADRRSSYGMSIRASSCMSLTAMTVR